MLYLLAFFISPLALLLAGKPFQAILNFIIYVLAWIGLFLIFVPGILFWAIGVAHACLVINNRNADRRNRELMRTMRGR